MSQWPSTQAPHVLVALVHIGWVVKHQSGSHKVLVRPGWPEIVFAFHASEEIGPHTLARIAKHSGLRPEDLHGTRRYVLAQHRRSGS